MLGISGNLIFFRELLILLKMFLEVIMVMKELDSVWENEINPRPS